MLVLAAGFAGCKFPDLPPIDELDGALGPDADLTQPQPLSVAIVGEGSVSSEPAGISCGATCTVDFDPGSTVTLTAEAAGTSVFEGWSGDCAGTEPCVLTMDGAKSATARFVEHGSVRWARQIGFAGDETSFAIAIDPANNVIAAGTIDDGAGFDLFVVKYAAADGQVAWMRHLDTPEPSSELFGDVAVDSDGNVYVATRLQGNTTPVSYDGHMVTGDVFGNIVVLRLAAANGVVEWARQWGGGGVDYPSAVAVVGADLYVAGYTSSGPSTFDGRSISATTNDGFVARASTATGAAADVKLLDGASDIYGIAAGGGHLAVAGAARGTTQFDGTCSVNVSGAGNDAMIFDLRTPDLTCQWARTYGDSVSNNDAYFGGVSPYPGGGWAMTGYFEGALAGFGGTALSSRGMFDIVAARLAADGQTSWAYRYGDVGGEVGRAVAITPAGNVVIAGDFSGSLVLGAHTVAGTTNAFVTRTSSTPTPTHEWAVSLGGPDADQVRDVALGADGSVYVLASFAGMTTVGGTALSSQGSDIWVAALVP